MTQSAIFTPAPPATGAVRTLTAPFRAIGHFMVLLAEANPRMKALNKLGRTSDETLAAQGTTRESEIRRIMGLYY